MWCASLVNNKRSHITPLVLAALTCMIVAFACLGQDDTSTVTIAQGTDATSLDPAFRADTATGNVILAIYDSLMVRDSDMEIKPWLATGAEKMSDTEWMIYLREDVAFSNGEPLNAAAVKYTLERVLDPETESPIKRWFSNFTGIEIVDEYTLKVITETIDPLFLIRLSLLLPVPPQYVEEVGDTEFARNPIGTGPYALVEWNPDDSITLAARDDYWAGPVRINEVIFRVVPEELSRVAALQTGEADIIVDLSPDQAEFLEGVPGVSIQAAPSTRVMVLTFDVDMAPADQRKFREAVAYAINRDELIEGLFQGFAQPVNSIFSPGVPGWPKEFDTTYPYDPDRAREILSELDLGTESIVLRSPSARYPQDAETALAIGGQLSEVGIPVQVRPEEWGSFFADLKDGVMSPIYLMGEGNVWIDPYPQLEAFFHSDGILTTYSDPGFDELMALSNVLEGEARAKVFGQILELLHWDIAAVPLFAQVYLYGVSDRVEWQGRTDSVIWVLEIELAE